MGKACFATAGGGTALLQIFGLTHSQSFIHNLQKSQSFCLRLLSIKCLRGILCLQRLGPREQSWVKASLGSQELLEPPEPVTLG